MKKILITAKNNLKQAQNYSKMGILFLSLMLVSCETLINDVDQSRLPAGESKLVVHGYLSPQDTLIQISVAHSSDVFGALNYSNSGNLTSIPDATVRISNQGKTFTLPFDAKNGTYSISAKAMPIIVGQTYTLNIDFQGKSVTSSCTVPKAVAIKEVRVDSINSRNVQSSNPNFIPPKDYLYRLLWQDAAGETNFYRVAGYVLETLKVQTTPNKFEERININSIYFWNNGRNGELISDQRSDGELLISETGRYSNLYGNSTGTTLLKKRIELMLLSCEKSYYDYHRTIQDFDRDNPFAEPSLVFSNIKGGLGCFAAYNRSSIVLKG
ncbi:MAG: DUF4249 domain-containing protein [Spirosomataceae bacterium]